MFRVNIITLQLEHHLTMHGTAFTFPSFPCTLINCTLLIVCCSLANFLALFEVVTWSHIISRYIEISWYYCDMKFKFQYRFEQKLKILQLWNVWIEFWITAATRKRYVISLEKKLKIIDVLKSGKSQRLVSDMFKVPKSTIGEILCYLASGYKTQAFKHNKTLNEGNPLLFELQVNFDHYKALYCT